MIASACARRGSQCGYFLAACVLFAALAFGANDVGAEEGRVYYKYTDDGGQLHIVQSLDRVPMQYRNLIGEIALEGDPVWTKITAPKRAPQPPAKYEPIKRRASRRKGASFSITPIGVGTAKKPGAGSTSTTSPTTCATSMYRVTEKSCRKSRGARASPCSVSAAS
jgi:hypothetical protein